MGLVQSFHSTLQTPTPLDTFVPAPERLSRKSSIPQHQTRTFFAEIPDCQITDRGTPTRRAKINYCLNRNGLTDVSLESFVEVNIGDLTVLFDDLNSGAHGTAGKFDLQQLTGIKNRVEDAIDFMCQVVVTCSPD